MENFHNIRSIFLPFFSLFIFPSSNRSSNSNPTYYYPRKESWEFNSLLLEKNAMRKGDRETGSGIGSFDNRSSTFSVGKPEEYTSSNAYCSHPPSLMSRSCGELGRAPHLFFSFFFSRIFWSRISTRFLLRICTRRWEIVTWVDNNRYKMWTHVLEKEQKDDFSSTSRHWPPHPVSTRPRERHLSIECREVRAPTWEPPHTPVNSTRSHARVTDPPTVSSNSRFNVSALLCLGLTVPGGRLSTSRVRNTEILASYSRETGAIPRES